MLACLDLDLKSQIVIDFEHCRMEKLGLEVRWTTRSCDYAPCAALPSAADTIYKPRPGRWKAKAVFMYRHLLLVSITLLWPFSAGLTTASAIAPPEDIIAPLYQTRAELILNLTRNGSLFNETLAHLQNFISYRVPNSPATLLFHSFGSTIPSDQLVQCIALAVDATSNFIRQGRGPTPIRMGYFKYIREYMNHDEIEIVVADFRESGRAMIYFELFDVVRGIGEFMIQRQHTQELDFEADFDGRGYLGTGHVEYKPFPTSTS